MAMLSAGAVAPEFELPDDKGIPVSLAGLRSAGPVLLAFFKVSCPTCQYTFPFLERISASGRLPIIGISQDSVQLTGRFRDAYALQFPILLDGAPYTVSNAFHITHVPSLFLVEPDGAISLSCSGFSRRELEEVGDRLGLTIFSERDHPPEYKPG